MEAICFSFDDFDLIVDAFDLPGVDRIIAVIDNTVAMALKHVGKTGQ
jgi:hypothetical protein